MRRKCKFCRSRQVFIFADLDNEMNVLSYRYHCETCGRFGYYTNENTYYKAAKTTKHISLVMAAELDEELALDEALEKLNSISYNNALWAAGIKNAN